MNNHEKKTTDEKKLKKNPEQLLKYLVEIGALQTDGRQFNEFAKAFGPEISIIDVHLSPNLTS